MVEHNNSKIMALAYTCRIRNNAKGSAKLPAEKPSNRCVRGSKHRDAIHIYRKAMFDKPGSFVESLLCNENKFLDPPAAYLHTSTQKPHHEPPEFASTSISTQRNMPPKIHLVRHAQGFHNVTVSMANISLFLN
jgi:hypothetical protein